MNKAGLAELVDASDLSPDDDSCASSSLASRTIYKTYGPYTRKDGRKHVIHIYNDKSRETQSYPRYLMEKYLGRKLLAEETVDHINEDYTDDRPENLQLLSREENARKSIAPAQIVLLTCKNCGKIFGRRRALEEYNRTVRIQDGPFCSHTCVGQIYN
jgi:hypothetical protein